MDIPTAWTPVALTTHTCYSEAMMEDKRTFYEWNESGEFPFKVLDPDGFPRHDVVAMQNQTYTSDEFYERAMRSTIQPLIDPATIRPVRERNG